MTHEVEEDVAAQQSFHAFDRIDREVKLHQQDDVVEVCQAFRLEEHFSVKSVVWLERVTEDFDCLGIGLEQKSSVFLDHQRKEHAARPEVVDVVFGRIVADRDMTFEGLLVLDVQRLLVLLVLGGGISVQRYVERRKDEPKEDFEVVVQE